MRLFSRVTPLNAGSSSCKPGLFQLTEQVPTHLAVQRTVSYLVDGQVLRPVELPISANGGLLKEVPDLVTRVQEVVITNMVVVVRGKLGHRMRAHVELLQEGLGAVQQEVNFSRVKEVRHA